MERGPVPGPIVAILPVCGRSAGGVKTSGGRPVTRQRALLVGLQVGHGRCFKQRIMDERRTLGRQQTDPQIDAAMTVPGESSRAAIVAVDAAAGAAAGAVAGIIAGPPGVALGAVIGGVVGAAAGVALGKAGKEERLHDEQLDREIGVSGGHIGEASVAQSQTAGCPRLPNRDGFS